MFDRLKNIAAWLYFMADFSYFSSLCQVPENVLKKFVARRECKGGRGGKGRTKRALSTGECNEKGEVRRGKVAIFSYACRQRTTETKENFYKNFRN